MLSNELAKDYRQTHAQRKQYARSNEIKEDFSDVYNRQDPRYYYESLVGKGYVIPEEAAPVFGDIFKQYGAVRDVGRPRVLDVGCSYGVNAATVNYGLSMQELLTYYTSASRSDLPLRERLDADTTYLSSHLERRPYFFVGADTAHNAVAYAQQVGLLGAGLTEDLEKEDPSPHSAALLHSVDVVVSTGCVGYVSDTTFRRIVRCADGAARPWIALFVLRMFSLDPIVKALASDGYVFHKHDERSFIQRQAADAAEAEGYRAQVIERGLTPREQEHNGLLMADFYLGRPADEADRDVGMQLSPVL